MDQNDCISDIDEQIIRDLVFLSKHKDVRKAEQIAAKYALKHVVEHGVGTPTSCGYNVALDINWNKVLIFSIMSHFWYHGPEFYGTNYGNLRWVSEGDVFER